MKKQPTFHLAAIALSIVFSACRVDTTPPAPAKPQPEVGIIPRPLQLEIRPGSFSSGPGMAIFVESADERAVDVARYLAERLGAEAGGFIPVSIGSQLAGQKVIVLAQRQESVLGTEGYRLNIQNDKILLEAATPEPR